MIKLEKYKNVDCITINTGRLLAKFLPNNGAKLTSLIDTKLNIELLAQNNSVNYKSINFTSSYVDGECSAFDDMFPTIDAFSDSRYLDHGEVCRAKHDYKIQNDSVVFTYNSTLLPYSYVKTVSVNKDNSLNVSYKITNLSNEELPCLWAGHIMLQGVEGGETLVPFKENSDIELCFCDNGNLPIKNVIPLKNEYLKQGNFSQSGSAYKFYFLNPSLNGKLSYKRLKDGITVNVCYDSSLLKYVGIWINNGTFKGMYNTALEMCTAPFDSPANAKNRGYNASIKANGSLEFTLKFSVENI